MKQHNLPYSQDKIPLQTATQTASSRGVLKGTTSITLGSNTAIVHEIVIVDLHNTDFDLILDIDTCSKLGIHLSGIPNPLTIHEQGERNRDPALITVLPTIDYTTYLGLEKRVAKQLSQCEKTPVTQWCNLPNVTVYLDDLVIANNNPEEHYQTVKIVLERLFRFLNRVANPN